MNATILLISAHLLAFVVNAATNDFLFIDNGAVRLGVKQSSGAGIAWFSESGTNQNLINHWDRGRLIQQSYYGNEDGSLWNKQPWRWNPVQGGDWKGSGAKVLEIRSTTNTLYSKTLPKNWAGGQDVTNTVMEQWITLTDAVAHVRFKFSYTGADVHGERDQEIPAVFIEPEFKNLVLYDGDKPWTGSPLHRSIPGWPNEGRKTTEHWAAYVDDKDFGIGVLIPVANRLTCYRFGDGKREHGSCSYFAPLTTFSIKPSFVFEYDAYLTIGSVEQIRGRFKAVADATSK
ncbi:MAG: hypothetical protein NTV12_10170 [Verrucomicrobia bacterium]|nr:hypothetical protein [Verrucomicrobiota bacterium]